MDRRNFLKTTAGLAAAPFIGAAGNSAPAETNRLPVPAEPWWDPWQKKILMSTSPRILVAAARQVGKTTVAAQAAIRHAKKNPDSVSVLIGTERSMTSLSKKLRHWAGPRDRTRHGLAIELLNGSWIVDLYNLEVRHCRLTPERILLVIDDAAHLREDAFELFDVVPELLRNCSVFAISTPNGKKGWFHNRWSGTQQWERHHVPASSCPRISSEFLTEEKQNIGEHWFQQEYEAKFV